MNQQLQMTGPREPFSCLCSCLEAFLRTFRSGWYPEASPGADVSGRVPQGLQCRSLKSKTRGTTQMPVSLRHLSMPGWQGALRVLYLTWSPGVPALLGGSHK
jgi:hypothetical protein